MKRFLPAVPAVILFCVAAVAGEHHHPAKTNTLLDQLKPLVGKWEATVEGQKITTTYSMRSNGSAILEELTPEGESMVNVIHADGNALMMTHYCADANQPRYRATKFDGNRIVFSFVDGTNLGDSYMSGVTLTLKDADHLTQEWSNRSSGKNEVSKFDFVRVR